MKKSNLVILAVATVLFQWNGIQSGRAQQIYFPAELDAASVSPNAAGKLIYQALGNHELIRAAASAAGITNLASLALVYNQKADTLEVVNGTNDTLVSTPLTFATQVYLSNTNATEIQRLAWVYWGTNQAASGTLLAGEENLAAITNMTVKPAYFSLQGQLQFAVPASGTNAAVIYAGNVFAQMQSPSKQAGCR
jgi:hypothetical protein